MTRCGAVPDGMDRGAHLLLGDVRCTEPRSSAAWRRAARPPPRHKCRPIVILKHRRGYAKGASRACSLETGRGERLIDCGHRLTKLQQEVVAALPADRRDTFIKEMATANQRRDRFLAAFVQVKEEGDEQHG